jgi:hypothetical protein
VSALLEWLQVETLERTQELTPLQADRQAHAQAVQQPPELDEIFASLTAAYRQVAEKLNLSLDEAEGRGTGLPLAEPRNPPRCGF